MIDPNGMEVIEAANSTTFTGSDAGPELQKLQQQHSSIQNNGGPGDGVKREDGGTSNIGDSFINGFKGGLNDTWQGVKGQFTLGGYMKGLGNAFTFGAISSTEMLMSGYNVVRNIPNYNADDYAYGTGFITEKVAETYLTRKAISSTNSALEFNLNEGWGLFGKKGLNIGNYKIEALYKNARGEGGTYLSVKKLKNGGNLLRWDLGPSHSTGQIGYHSTFRFNINEKTYGSSGQYPSYAPFQFWKYKQ